MAENKQDILIRAYAMLQSLRKNIDQIPSNIEEKYAKEFHSALDRLQTIGIDVTEFRIPDSEVQHLDISPIRTLTFKGNERAKHYSKEKYVEKPLILTKLDAILGYFEIITAEKPKTIGFHKPDNQ